ncbi:VOC family protein [Streptomyces sp. NPDC050658]|uniref:VOC family protein n=1 Tax=unclassified Streptomyces TaxID=2593676 RepID=UPI003433BDE6
MGLITAGAIVLDCSEPEELAQFYLELLDAEPCPDTSSNRTDIETSSGLRMGFRRDVNATPPSWPRPEDSLQAHVDFLAEAGDLDELERHIVTLGGTPIEASGRGGPTEARLYADPAGHSFTVRASPSHGPKAD